MSGYDQLEKAAADFIENSKLESFDLDDLNDLLPAGLPEKDRPKELERLGNILDSFSTVARRHSDDTYYILQNFFRGTCFFCKPRKWEIDAGILVPGVRFEPYHPVELYPAELELDLNGKTAERKEWKTTYGKISDLFFLMGPAGTVDMLTAESQLNYENLRRFNGLRDEMQLELEVFDFADFYRDSNFREGDLLRFEIRSWADGQFRVSVVRKVDTPSPADAERYLTSFENALAKVCVEYKDSFEIPEQIEYAYLYAARNSRTDIRKTPGVPIDLYHTVMRNISFRRDGMEWTLSAMDDDDLDAESPESCDHEQDGHHDAGCGCSCGHDHAHEHGTDHGDLTFDDLTLSQGSMDSLEEILRDVHAPVHEIELHAMMLDTLANGSESFEEFERVYEEFLRLPFTDEAQETAFHNYVEDLWELTAEHYGSNLDSKKVPLRTALLEVTRRRIDLSRLLLESGRTLPEEFRDEFLELHRDLLHTLGVLGMDADLEEAEYDNLELRVGDIEEKFDLLSDKISEWMEKKD